MGPIDALFHLTNLFLPALMLAALAPALAKLAWRRELAAVPWKRLALWAAAANCAVVLLALLLLGRDGRMGMYAAMVVASALTLWWRGFGPGR